MIQIYIEGIRVSDNINVYRIINEFVYIHGLNQY